MGGGQRSEFFRQRDIYPTKFNREYNGLQRPNISELPSLRSAITAKNLSKYRATRFWTRFVLGVMLKRDGSGESKTGGPRKNLS